MREFHNTTEDMVKCFVQYMPCDSQVQREAASCGRPMDLRTVAAIRARYERQKAMPAPTAYENVPAIEKKYTRNMNAANQRFVCALLKARAA